MSKNATVLQKMNRIAGDGGFKNKTLLITGATGFMGKVLLEKILRTCPLVKKIYVMVRPKKGVNPQTRMEQIFAGPLFDLLKQTRGPDIVKKVVAIPGDVSLSDLGLSAEHRQMLTDEVDFIFHLAATIRFDEELKKAIVLNTRGTKLIIGLAKQCKKLTVFIYTSTAYCHLNERMLYEKPYPPPANPHNVLSIVEELDDKSISLISKRLLGTYPNTYAYTKALAEGLVCDELDNLPVIILRLPVVIPIWTEPLPGWTDNINGPTGLLIAAGKGLLRTMYCDPKGYADYLPVDIAANAIIVATYDYLTQKKRRIYNCTSSSHYKVSWTEIIELGRKVIETRIPLNGVVWYPGGSMNKSKWVHYLYVVFFHYLPAIFLDALIILSGNKPVLWKVQQRITKGFDVFEYYTNNQWDFSNEEMLKVRDWMNDAEKKIYKLDGDGLDFEEYFYNCTHSARLHILHEGDDTLPAARRHMKIMWVVDKLSKILIFLAFFYMLWYYLLRPVVNSVSLLA